MATSGNLVNECQFINDININKDGIPIISNNILQGKITPTYDVKQLDITNFEAVISEFSDSKNCVLNKLRSLENLIKHQSVNTNNKLKIENEKLRQENNRLKDWIDALLKNVHNRFINDNTGQKPNDCIIAKEVSSIKKKSGKEK